MVQPDYGIGGGGNIGFLPYGVLDALYPYYTYGPNMAFQLAQMGYTGQMNANLANQDIMMRLAQMGGSGQLRDYLGQQLYLNGLGQQPGMFSSLGGMSPFVQAPNPAGLFNQQYSQLPSWMQGPNTVGGGGGGGGGLAPDPLLALMDLDGDGVIMAKDALLAMRQGNQDLGNQILRNVAGLGGGPGGFQPDPRMTTQLGPNGLQPYRPNDVMRTSYTQPPMQQGSRSLGGSAPTTGGIQQLPWYQQLMGNRGAGPAWSGNMARPTAPELGINQGVPLPFEASNRFRQMNPMQQSQTSQLWTALGIPPDYQNYWLNASTPGYRATQQRGLGF